MFALGAPGADVANGFMKCQIDIRYFLGFDRLASDVNDVGFEDLGTKDSDFPIYLNHTSVNQDVCLTARNT